MNRRIRCFLLEATEMVEKSLRRFAKLHYLCGEDGEMIVDRDGKATLDPVFDIENHCPGSSGHHNASVVIDSQAMESVASFDPEDHSDPRWPKKCSECDYLFQDFDHYQMNHQRIFFRSDDHSLITLSEAPEGAMWNAYWMGDLYRGPDGKCLVLRTPVGDWTIDGPTRQGGKWTRTGKPPDITVNPSILFEPVLSAEGKLLVPGFHGWLRDGWLEEI